jgi:hypothetical protein
VKNVPIADFSNGVLDTFFTPCYSDKAHFGVTCGNIGKLQFFDVVERCCEAKGD